MIQGRSGIGCTELASRMVVARQWHEGRHAIVQAAFAVELATAPLPLTIRELLALYSKFKDKYPRRQEKLTVGIPLGSAEVMDRAPVEPILGGFNFDSLKPDGNIERSIALNAKMLTITRADYERWHTTWIEVRSILALMLPILLQRGAATSFHLQYQNRFLWEGDVGTFRADALFRKGSPFLAPNAFDAEELWHSNHGYFTYPDRYQLLSTADVQAVLPERVGLDDDPRLGVVVEVRLSHRIIHGVERAGADAKPIGAEDELLGGPAVEHGLLDRYMNEMHERNNWLLARLIHNDMCDKISLPRPE
jgi:uncharacterized protein (TIGR04255 family)